jgi:hypothetical protein
MLGGCLRTIGCATVLVVGGAVALLTRDRWYPALRGDRDRAVVELPADTLSPDGAARAEASLRDLQRPRGPAFVNITPADLAALIVREAGRRGPLPLKRARAGTVADELWLQGALDIRALRAQGVLGSLGKLLGDEEEVELRGTLDIVRPGLAQFHVTSFKVRDFPIPSPAIPRLVRELQRERPEGVSADAVAFAVPEYIGDARIANGRVTLYKTMAPARS